MSLEQGGAWSSLEGFEMGTGSTLGSRSSLIVYQEDTQFRVMSTLS